MADSSICNGPDIYLFPGKYKIGNAHNDPGDECEKPDLCRYIDPRSIIFVNGKLFGVRLVVMRRPVQYISGMNIKRHQRYAKDIRSNTQQIHYNSVIADIIHDADQNCIQLFLLSARSFLFALLFLIFEYHQYQMNMKIILSYSFTTG